MLLLSLRKANGIRIRVSKNNIKSGIFNKIRIILANLKYTCKIRSKNENESESISELKKTSK
ncbi:MAG: hypothetical protein R3A12_16465 [Ignavibacteria bacterium]